MSSDSVLKLKENKEREWNYMAKENKLLVIEDSKEDFEIMLRAFREGATSLELAHVTTGDKAFEYLEQKGEFHSEDKPAIVLLDLSLPGMSGLEFLQLIKSNFDFKDIPVIVFTGSQSKQDIQECKSLGAYRVLEKPKNYWDFKEMAKKISELIKDLKR